LVPDPKLAQPAIDTGWPPAIAVAGDHELVPVAFALLTANGRAELLLGSASDSLAVLGRGCRIAQRPTSEVAAVADEVAEQHHAILGPGFRCRRVGKPPRDSDPISWFDLTERSPAGPRADTMLRGRGQHPPGRQPQPHD